METQLTKPFLKWVGGKTQIINQLIKIIPKEMNNYHELFLGGGSVLLALLSLEKDNKISIEGKIYAYDLNFTLIQLYKHIQTNKDKLFENIKVYLNEYNSCKGTIINRKPKTIEEAKSSKESYYYWLRNEFNKMDKKLVKCAALFMIINKTCFRGMYREGPNGFNIPYGHYKKTPNVITKNNLDNISELIKNVEFICADFKDSFKNIKSGDFVYLDPPYAPVDKTSFVGYTSKGFDLETHKSLFNLTNELTSKNVKFMMSNAKVDLVMNNFKDYEIFDILCRRAINSKNPGSTVMEVIITN